MRKALVTFYLLLFTFLSTARAQELCHRLDSVVQAARMLETSQMGLLVYDLDVDSVLYARDARQTLRPASTMKLLTAITALDKLGGEYEYVTSLKVERNASLRNASGYENERPTAFNPTSSILAGNVFLVGAMDPLISEADLKVMADSLRRMGIDTIRGMIYADRSMKEDDLYGEGWCWDDDNPMLSALVLNRKDDMAERLRGIFIRSGIYVTGGVASGRCPDDAEEIYEISHKLRDVLVPMMKQSNNLYAESVYYQTGLIHGKPSTAKKARNVQEALLERIFRESPPLVSVEGEVPIHRFADGSGLSLYNYLSAEIEVAFLRYAYGKEHIYKELIEALPIAGVDGTLKDRMRGTCAEGNVRAKTGTLSGVFSLAGYCKAGNGHHLAFAIINQGVMKGAYARGLQDRICVELAR